MTSKSPDLNDGKGQANLEQLWFKFKFSNLDGAAIGSLGLRDPISSIGALLGGLIGNAYRDYQARNNFKGKSTTLHEEKEISYK